MGPPSTNPYASSSYMSSPHIPSHEQLFTASRYARSPHGHTDSISSQPTAHDINHVVADTAFIGEVTSSEHRSQVGHFMGAASGVSLTRMVLDAVLRTGTASAPPASNRESMIMPAQVSRKNSDHNGSSLRLDPSLGGRGTSTGPASATDSEAGTGAQGVNFDGHSTSPADGFTSPSYQRRDLRTSPLMHHQHRPPISVPALPPPAAVDRLVQVYVDFVQIMLPILHMPTFQKMLTRVRGKSPDVTDADIFFVLMVLGG
jgi:hypothetical protein